MPQFVRFGCAGIAVIIIAALTSVGLYAVLTGGFPFGGPAPKPITGGAQVLVTIQAGQPTATPPSASTPTPPPGSTSPGVLAAPIAAAAPAPTQTVPPTATVTPAAIATAVPAPAASPASNSAAAAARPDPGKPTTYEGLAAEILEVERGWQATDATGAPLRLRDGSELLTVQIRLTNNAPETRYVSDSDLALVSEDGARFAARQVMPQREPRLLTTPLLPGDVVRGWLTYEVPAGQAARRLQWSPTRPDRPRAETTFNLILPQ